MKNHNKLHFKHLTFGSNIFWTTGKMHSNLRTDQVRQNLTWSVSVSKKKWHRNTKSKEKQGSRRKHSHRFRTTCSAKEQNAGLGREDDGGGLQTDPVVDFPKHCILLHSFFINIGGVTEKRNPKEVTVFVWVICFAARGGEAAGSEG